MLEGFGDYLVRKAALNNKYIPYYVKWVSSCYSFINLPDDSLLAPDQMQNYLNHISKTREDWQVKQAETALRLYGYYLSAEVGEKAEVIDSGTAGDGSLWKILEKKTRDALRLRHRSYSTEKTYIGWLRAFSGYCDSKPPPSLTVADMQNFLSSLAVERHVSSSTQNQALNALIFVYRYILEIDPGPEEIRAVRALPKRRLPVVLSAAEVQSLFCHISGTHLLMTKLIYGCGLRIKECMHLRIKDIDLDRGIVTVWGKGTCPPKSVPPVIRV